MLTFELLKSKILETGEFYDNIYTDKYIDIILSSYTSSYINNIQDNYTNEHHIIPRSYYKYNKKPVDNSETNLCTLLFKDHILAHYYLYKCAGSDLQKYSNSHAVIHLLRQQYSMHYIDNYFFDIDLNEYQEIYNNFRNGVHDILVEKCSGQLNGNCKVSIEQCDEIKILLNTTNFSYQQISDITAIPTTIIASISTGKHWSCKNDNYKSERSKTRIEKRRYNKEHKNYLEKTPSKKYLYKLEKERLQKIEDEKIKEWSNSQPHCIICGELIFEYRKSRYGDGIFCSSSCLHKYIARNRSKEHYIKAMSNRRSFKGENNPNYGKHFSEESHIKHSLSQKRVQTGARIMIKGNERRRVIKDKQAQFLADGYVFLTKER